MPRNYLVLTPEQQHDTVVEFYFAQEKDHFCHTINAERYAEMLKVLPAGPFKDKIQKDLADTHGRLIEVETILDKTASQMPTGAKLTAAIARRDAKEASAQNKP